MDTLIYALLCFSVFASIFLFGWQFGCWMVQRNNTVQRDNKEDTHDYYTDKFHDYYYDGSSCKSKTKKKAKKTSGK